MTRTNNKPEPLARPIAMFVRASMLDKHSQLGTKQSLDPPPRAARLGAASGVEGPGRAQRPKGASTTHRASTLYARSSTSAG